MADDLPIGTRSTAYMQGRNAAGEVKTLMVNSGGGLSMAAGGGGAGTKLVAVAGTPETLVAASTVASQVQIQPLSTNTGDVFVSLISSPGSGIRIPVTQTVPVTIGIDNLQKVYIDAAVSGEGVTYIYTA